MPIRPRALLRVLLLGTLVAAIGWGCLPVGPLDAEVPAPRRPPAGRLPWLSTANGRIVDEQGRAVLLRGFNVSALLEWPSLPPAPLDESDAALMRAAGFNVVRLPISWSRLEPQPGEIDQAYLEQVARTVAMLNQHDLYVILDMHFSLGWGPRFEGAGAPDWATLSDLPDLPESPTWLRELISPALLASETYFWLSPNWQANFQQAWQAVAARFRDESGLAGYDLFNEPHPHLIPPHVFEKRWMWPFYARTIEAIGAVDPNHLFIVESSFFFDAPSPVVPLAAPNLVYSPHLYTGSLVPPPITFAPGRLPHRIYQQAAEARQVPAVPWWGELGIDHALPYARQWADLALDTFDELQVGWAWWQWRQDLRWGIRSRDGTEIDEGFLRLLARPFVVAAPPGVRGGQADGLAGWLELMVSPDHADLPVEVSWSTATLPPPLVAGDCVRDWRWEPATARITLALTPGQGCLVVISAAPETRRTSPTRIHHSLETGSATLEVVPPATTALEPAVAASPGSTSATMPRAGPASRAWQRS